MSLKKLFFELCLVFALYGFLTFLFFPKIFSSEVYIGLGDAWSQFYSRYAFFKESIQRGVFPLWNPLVLCGIPSGLDAVSDFSVINFLLLFLGLNGAWNANQFVTPLLSAWILFLILRKHFSLSAVSAFLGGFILLANTVKLAPDNLAYFLVPLMFFLMHQWVKKGSWFWAFLVSVTLTYYLLNANAQYVLYAGFFLWAYGLMELWTRSEKKGFVTMAQVLIQSSTPFIFTLGLSAFHIFRVYELLSLSHRGLAVKRYVHMFFPTDLIFLFYPNFYKSSVHPEVSFLLPNAVSKIIAMISDDRLFQIRPPYIGVIPLTFGALMFFKKEKTRCEKFLLAFSVGMIVYMMLNPITHWVIQWIPILNKLPTIWRLYNLYYLGMAILAAFFFESLWARTFQEDFDLTRVFRVTSIFLMVFLVVLLLRLVFEILLLAYEGALVSFIKEVVLARLLESQRFKASPEFYLGRLQQFLLALKSWASFGNTYFLLSSFLWIASLFWLQRFLLAKISRNLFLLGFFPLLLLDFLSHMKPSNSFRPEKLLPYQREALFLRDQPGLFRVMPLQPIIDEKSPHLLDPRVDTRNVILRPETNQIYGLATPEGFRSLLPLRYVRFEELFTGKPHVRFMVGEFQDINESFADLMNLKYILTTAGRQLEEYRKIYEGQNRAIFLNEDVLERAFFVHEVWNYRNGESAFRALKVPVRGLLDFSKEAILEDDELSEGKHLFGRYSEKDKVRITHYAPNQVDLEAYSEFGGLLVLTDTYFPGWKATIDGKSQEISIANVVFRGLKISPGSHFIRFVYQPDSLRLGLGMSVASLALGICFLTFLKDHPSA